MAENTMDYQTMLADMEAKKTVLEQAISSLRAAIAIGALGQPGDIQAGTIHAASISMGGAMELPVGALLNKSVPAAIKLYLSTIRKKQTTQQIAVALKAGGVGSTPSDFETIVAGGLHRLKVAGEVLRFPDGWGFAAHYPDHIRKAISQNNKPSKKKTKKVAKIKAQPKNGPEKKVKAQVVPITKSAGLVQRIESILKADKGRSFTPAEIAKIFEVDGRTAAMTLGRMAAKGRIEKAGNGTYRAPGGLPKTA